MTLKEPPAEIAIVESAWGAHVKNHQPNAHLHNGCQDPRGEIEGQGQVSQSAFNLNLVDVGRGATKYILAFMW